MTDNIETTYPEIPWRKPIRVKLTDGSAEGYFCRLCIARYGLEGRDVAPTAKTEKECLEHIETHHPA